MSALLVTRIVDIGGHGVQRSGAKECLKENRLAICFGCVDVFE
jgi:hypothetical protein